MRRVILVALTVCAATSGLTCGGTSGREGLPVSATGTTADADTDADATAPVTAVDGGDGLDATTANDSLITGAFDVALVYVDRALPDVQVASEAGSAGGDAAAGLPDCPPFIPFIRVTGQVAPLGQEDDQVPAVYADDGGETFAPDGSICATYPWLGSVALDQCVTAAAAGGPPVQEFPFLPPCSWAVEAGTASQGDGMGRSRYDLCIALYQCYLRTGCYLNAQNGVKWCFCGSDPATTCQHQPQGACLSSELDALEIPSANAAAESAQILLHLTTVNVGSTMPGEAARQLNFVFNQINTATAYNGCDPLALQAFDGGTE